MENEGGPLREEFFGKDCDQYADTIPEFS